MAQMVSQMDTNEPFLYKTECFEIIGAAMEVHNNLGSGFLEAVYQEALSIEFDASKIPFEEQANLEIEYKGITLDKRYTADFICYGEIIIELKAVESLASEHVSQVLNYLKSTGLTLGLLINFGSGKLQYKRVIR